MKINIIHNDKSSNVMMDAEILSYIFKRFKQKPKIEHIHINSYKILSWIRYSKLRKNKIILVSN